MDRRFGTTPCAAVFLSTLLIGAGALAKYFAIALIPLLVVYSLCKTKRLGSWLCFLLIPMAVLCFYEWATRSLYSHGLVLDAFRYVKETYAFSWRSAGLKLFTALAFFGGCHAVVLTLTPFLWRPRVWIAGAVLTGGLEVSATCYSGGWRNSQIIRFSAHSRLSGP